MPSHSDKPDFSKFVVDHTANQAVDGPTRCAAYTFGGRTCEPDDTKALARIVTDEATGTEKHFLKRATQGPETGRLYNPHSMYFEPGRANAVHQFLGRGQYQWTRVRKDQFELYLTFLRTDDLRHLRQAERE